MAINFMDAVHNIQTSSMPNQQIDQYIQLLRRRLWLIILTAIPVLLLGIGYCLITPLTYKTTTTIVVVPQRVPEAYVKSTVTGRNEDRIRTILQEITSRTNLEAIIKEFDLYPEARQKLPMESVVELMREKIQIEQPRTARGNAFVLTFEGKDPVLITKVLNAMANMFVEENLKLRESQAEMTATFLSSQLEKIYSELKQREEALKKYKMEHMGELPEQRDSNIATLNNLQQQLEGVKESIRRAQDRKLLLQQQYAQHKARLQRGLAQNLAPNQGEQSNYGSGESAPASLNELQQQLKQLLSRYTEQHPDVIALKRQIEERKKELAGQSHNQSSTVSVNITGDPFLDNINFQLRNIELEIGQLKRDAQSLQEKITLYEKRIENTPKREQELIDLTRDYDNLRETYQNLLQRKIEAEQAAALERKQQGEHFRIIDPARIPEKPIKPDLKKVLPIVLILALGISIGAAFALEFISKSFYDPEDVSKAVGLPILICVPYIYTEKELRRKRFKIYAYLATALAGYGTVGLLLLILFKKGPGAFSYLI